MMKIISFIVLIYFVRAQDLEKCTTYSKEHNTCGYIQGYPHRCDNYEKDKNSDNSCVLKCSYYDDQTRQCGGDENRCEYFVRDYITLHVCTIPCEFVGPKGCGNEPSRCSTYSKNKEGDKCVNDCSINAGGCGGDTYECNKKYEKDPSNYYKCRLKCTSVGDHNFCGGDEFRCKDYEVIYGKDRCRMKCTIFQNNSCGSKDDYYLDTCQDTYIKDPDNPTKCIHYCEQLGSLGCGNDATKCSSFQQIPNVKKCQRNCTVHGVSECGDDKERCSDYVYLNRYTHDYKFMSKFYQFGSTACGDDTQKCSDYKKDPDSKQCIYCSHNDNWTNSQCHACFGQDSYVQFDKKDCENKQTYSQLLSFSIFILAIIL